MPPRFTATALPIHNQEMRMGSVANEFDTQAVSYLEWRQLILEQSMTQLGHAALLLSHRAEIIFSSPASKAIFSANDGLSLSKNGIVASIALDQERLHQAIKHASTSSHYDCATLTKLYIHRPSKKRPYQINVMPLHVDTPFTEDVRNATSVMLIIQDLQAELTEWSKRLKEIYELTPRESEALILLTEGRDLKEIAAHMNIKFETMRKHIKFLFQKTQSSKQHELVIKALQYKHHF